MRITLQQDEKDCGIACLDMIFRTYKTHIPFYKLRNSSETDLNGTTAIGLKNCAEKYGFNFEAIRATDAIWLEKDLPFPLIAHVIVNQTYMHFVVVYGIRNGLLTIADPAKGKIKKTIKDFSKEWTGLLFVITPSDTYKPQKEKLVGIISSFPILWKYKSLIFRIVLLSFLVTIIGIAGSYYFQGVLDYFIPKETYSILNIVSIALIFAYLFQILFQFIRNYLLAILGQRMSMEIILNYFKHVINLPMNFFCTRSSGEIISRFLDANKIIDALATTILSTFLDLTMIFIVGSYLVFKNKMLFFITLASLPFYILSIFAFFKSYEIANRKEMESGAALNSSIIESIKGIETIKAYNAENYIYDCIESKFLKLMKKSFKTVLLDNLQQGIKYAIQLINSIIIIWIGSYYVINNSITIGDLITYNSLLVFFTGPLQNIVNLQAKIQTAQVANKRLNEILSILPEYKEDNYKINTSREILKSEIKLSNVKFSYNIKTPVLKGVSFKIPENSKVALVGISGSGKSTLAKLLVKFHHKSSGEIFFGDIENTDINYKFLREHITYVPQESFFFNGTILENLTFGLNYKPTLQYITDICNIVQLTDLINKQPLKFNTIVEEGGSNFSGGQKQRFAIARALLKNSDILILDEATSAMDAILQSKVVNNLLHLDKKTIIFITHNLSISKACDKIIVMHKGKIVEQGNHDYLKSNNGLYQQLLDL